MGTVIQMNALYITHYTDMLGANRSLLQLILELRKFGVNATVLLPPASPNNISELSTELSKNNINYIELPIHIVKHNVAWKAVAHYVISLFKQIKIRKKIGDVKIDIIHTNSSIISIGSYLSKKLGAKHVWHLREFGDLDYNLKTPFGKWFQRFIYSGNNNFIAISEKIKSHYLPYIGKQSITLIYNGINPPCQYPKSINPIIRFCVVGLLHPNKGQIDVINAVYELVNQFKITNFHVTIIGSGKKEYSQFLNNYVIDKGLSSFIEFTGYRKDVNEILSSMDVGIMASSNEAFGRVTIEYMMSGLAVIATDGGANKEIITDGNSGLIYKAGNHLQLAHRMVKFINNPEYLREVAIQGRKHAITNYSSETNTKKIIELYKTLLAQ